MKRTILLFLTGILILPLFTFSQSNRWKRTRYEATAGVGVTSFMGDLGGGAEASHFVSDFNFTAQRPLLTVGLRYKVLERVAAKGTLSYGWVSANDNKSDDIYRLDRNLSFRSPIVEFAALAEYSIIKEPVSHRYSLKRGKKFSLKSLKINTYVFAGVAGFWFNPRGLDDAPGGTGKWVSLQPLGTEGQGLMEGREKYSRVQLAFPFGLGIKYPITRDINIGIEFGARYTLTDYIDDVSTTYIDNAWLASVDPLAARMADKSIQTNDDTDPNPNATYSPGEKRGDSSYNDFYMFSVVTISYKLRTGRNGLPKF